MVDDTRAGQLHVWGDLPSGRVSFTLPPDTDVAALTERLAQAVTAAIASVCGEIEWSFREPKWELHSCVIESEAQCAERQAREAQERIAAYAAAPDVETLERGFVRIKTPPRGYRLELHGRPYDSCRRCSHCEWFGAYADTGRCENCEPEQ